MKIYKSNSRLVFLLSFAILMVVNSVVSYSENDTISTTFKSQFQNNLNDLNDLYCWSDTSFYQGHCQFQSVENIQDEFQKLNFPFYVEYSELTDLYYQFLEGIEIEKKEKLIHFYSFYEREIEVALKDAGLPAEIKYLAPALSAMNPKAVNANQLAGIWQLTHFQAMLNGLQINKLVDERFDISLSTIAAIQQIKQNLEQFRTIELALAAQLFGNVKVQNAIKLAERNGGAVRDFLPKLLNEKIAVIQAMSVFLNVNQFKEKTELLTVKKEPDTVKVNRQLHFQQVSKVLAIPLNELQYLNPKFKYSIVAGDNKSNQLVLPNGKWDDFVLWQDSIYNTYDSTLFQVMTQKIEYAPLPNRQYGREPVKDLEIEGKTKIQYRLKTGDVLGIIAENFDVRVADLKYWNNIYNERKIQAGRKLDIFVDDDNADYYLSLATPQKKKKEVVPMVVQFQKSSTLKVFEDLKSAKKVVHIVKNGESPYLIAKKYVGVTPDDILEWNNIDDARKIQIGQKLIVYLKE